MQTTLGLSNISFGLNPAARVVLNSVFLDECVKAGPGLGDRARQPRSCPSPGPRGGAGKTALDLIYDRRSEGYDPLQS